MVSAKVEAFKKNSLSLYMLLYGYVWNVFVAVGLELFLLFHQHIVYHLINIFIRGRF
jgi:hypothetical protein